jgi:hypothetical protein
VVFARYNIQQQTSDFEIFFSATSFYPGRDHHHDHVIAHVSNQSFGDEQFSDGHDGETEIESEDDWFAEPQPLEPASRKSSKMSDALALEVSALSFFLSCFLQLSL